MNIPWNYRLDCLRLAHGTADQTNPPAAVVERAETYYAFVKGSDKIDGEDKDDRVDTKKPPTEGAAYKPSNA